MSVYFKASLIAASLAAAVTVSAQPMPAASSTANCPANTDCRVMKKSRSERHARRPVLTTEQRMARFDNMAAQQAQALQITAAQRPLWDAYVQTKKAWLATKRPGLDRQNMGGIAADERAEWRARHMEAAAQHARQMANSTKTLRDALTPEQRNRFDQMSMLHGQGNTFRQSEKRRHATIKQAQPAEKPAPIKR